jgi:hypothetical protein
MLPAGDGRRDCGISEGAQAMMTVMLIYTSGFLVIVASVLVAMLKTVARREY